MTSGRPRFTIAELMGAVAIVAVGCVRPVLFVPAIVFGLSQVLARRRRSLGLSLAVVSACLYAPFAWLLTGGMGDYQRFWLNLWPILPGFVPAVVLAHPHDTLEFSLMGGVTVVLLVGLTWLGSLGKYRLAAAAGIALVLSGYQSICAYSAFVM